MWLKVASAHGTPRRNNLHVLYRGSRKINSSTDRTRIRRIILSRPRGKIDCTFSKFACIDAPLTHSTSYSPTLRTTPSHYFLFHLFFFCIYAHSETHGRSCKKIKEKAIVSVGGSFSCRSRSMAHEVADICNIHTHTRVRAHTHTYVHIIHIRTASWIRDYVCFDICFFFLFIFFLQSRCRTWASTAPSSDLHLRFDRSTKRSLSFSVSTYQASILARRKWLASKM